MTIPEFSDEFDVLYNNIMSNQAPGLDEYEKSVMLTKGAKETAKNYFNPAGNKYQQGFDGSPKRQADFSTLIVNTTLNVAPGDSVFDTRAYRYLAPDNIFLSINEYLTDESLIRYQVIPIAFDEYLRMMSKPYGYPVKRQAWKLITDKVTSIDENNPDKIIVQSVYEIIGRFKLSENEVPKYHIRYLKNPAPIILVDLSSINSGLTIDGQSGPSECDLPEELHPEVLQRAVEIAKSTYAGDINTAITTGARTE